jgi:predicted ArsR family transcriptional regulator
VAASQSRSGLASLSSLDDPVRSRLYDFVSGRSEPVGRDEAAAAVGIGRALAVYHLDRLVEAGLLTASYQRPPGRSGPGAGRPAKVYIRSGREFAATVPPREYELAARLLARAVESDDSGRSRAALHEAAAELGAELGTRGRAATASGHVLKAAGARGAMEGARGAMEGAQDAEESARDAEEGAGTAHMAEHAVESVLQERGFEPWHDEDGVVRLRNCPFRALAERHPGVICGMNLALIEGLIAGIDASGLRPALDPQPGLCCVAIGAQNP